MVVVDASHGGDERGAALTEQLPEKDVTLAVARRLRQELQNRGVFVLMLRDSDSTLLPDQRAAAVNGVHASAYICVHASSQGLGVRLYTAAIPMGDENRGPFVAWDTAQAPALPLSQIIASAVALELQRRQVGARVLSAPLRPLNDVIAPSVAVELAPPDANVLNLASPSYEELVAIAVANGVAQLRSRLEAQR
jgi:N-acetylmuramoyl-L-alanine amidase